MYIDTNILMRYLLNDIPEQTDMAAEIIAGGAQIYPEVIPEALSFPKYMEYHGKRYPIRLSQSSMISRSKERNR